MKKKTVLPWIVVVVVVWVIGFFAYPYKTMSQTREDEEQSALVLSVPTLEMLIDSALSYAPTIDNKKVGIDITSRELRTKRWEWLKHISLQANYQYGNLQNFASYRNQESTVSDGITVSTQNRYSFSIVANFPISSFWDRQNQNKIARLKIDQAISELEAEKQSVRQLVINLYSQLLLEHESLLIAISSQQSTKLQMIMAKKQFANGQMLLIDFANMKQLELQAEKDMKTAKVNFRKTKTLLEDIVGFKF